VDEAAELPHGLAWLSWVTMAFITSWMDRRQELRSKLPTTGNCLRCEESFRGCCSSLRCEE
jgi:hypothetical protein